MPKSTRVQVKTRIPKVLKDHVWTRWVGDDVARTACLCCGQNEIKMNSFHCGHVVAESVGGATSVENLRPICATCNQSMGAENMDAFRLRCGFAAAAAAPVAAPVKEAPIVIVSAPASAPAPLSFKAAFMGTAKQMLGAAIQAKVNEVIDVAMTDRDVARWAPHMFNVAAGLIRYPKVITYDVGANLGQIMMEMALTGRYRHDEANRCWRRVL
jgi:hypothetical protein